MSGDFERSALSSILSDFKINDTLLKRYTGTSTDILVPSVVENIGDNAFNGCRLIRLVCLSDGVKTLGINSFYGCISLNRITIPNGVTSIAKHAFHGCSSLETITLPDSVTDLDECVFMSCKKLANIKLPLKVKIIKQSLFNGCKSLKEIHLPETVEQIDDMAFFGCSALERITIPSSVKAISEKAFTGCPNITIEAPLGSFAQGFANKNGISFFPAQSEAQNDPLAISGSHKKEHPKGGAEKSAISKKVDFIIENDVLKKYCGNKSCVSIPAGVVKIGCNAFSMCKWLREVSVPDSVTIIDRSAFYQCENLSSVSLPNSLEEIAPCAFYGCSSLSFIQIPSKVRHIESSAFYNCSSLSVIIFSKGVKMIRREAFWGCTNLSYICFPSSVTSIAQKAFPKKASIAVFAPEKSFAEQYAEMQNFRLCSQEEIENELSRLIPDKQISVIPQKTKSNETVSAIPEQQTKKENSKDRIQQAKKEEKLTELFNSKTDRLSYDNELHSFEIACERDGKLIISHDGCEIGYILALDIQKYIPVYPQIVDYDALLPLTPEDEDFII